MASRHAGLETRDTAGLETCDTLLVLGGVM
jgi:hypothetical protein